jgi:hypothetical protein
MFKKNRFWNWDIETRCIFVGGSNQRSAFSIQQSAFSQDKTFGHELTRIDTNSGLTPVALMPGVNGIVTCIFMFKKIAFWNWDIETRCIFVGGKQSAFGIQPRQKLFGHDIDVNRHEFGLSPLGLMQGV